MTINCTVLYPNDNDATFDMKYYLDTHMPLVLEKFGPYVGGPLPTVLIHSLCTPIHHLCYIHNQD
jgi:hypothetical protein